jgi:hypothetical protein
MAKSRLASGVLASALVSGVLVAVPGISASAAPIDCPTVFPTASAVDGVIGTGYTVERGTTADPFTATVLGRINGGIAPGIDMIMADLSSPALTRAGGVWAGMSGSPVYAPDGRLIGSVSYGLASSSPIAGITPAADMQKLLTASGSASTKAKIKISGTTATRIAKTGAVSAAKAASGFQRLPLPVSVSGAGSGKFLKDLTQSAGLQVRSGGAKISAAASSPSEITAGSNFAAVLAYGDVSIAGIGTTTFVCRGEAVAFGHPLLNAGDAEYTAHPATAVYVQPDPVNGPFKEANPGGPVGIVTRDATTGIRATLGEQPTSSFAVTSSLRPDGAAAVTGSSTGIYQPYAGDIGALHLQANIIKALGAQRAGSAALTFTIRGTRADGTPFTLIRSDHYADTADIAFTAADDLFFYLKQLVDQPFDALKITSVDATGDVSSAINQYRVTSIKVKTGGKWVQQKGVLRVTAGRTIPLQLGLTKYRSSSTVVVPLTVRVPTGSQGAMGTLTISDALSASTVPADPTSLTTLLAQLATAAPNDAVAGSLSLITSTKSVAKVTLKKVDAAVSSYSKDIPIEVKP